MHIGYNRLLKALSTTPVFVNLFAAAEPCVSVKTIDVKNIFYVLYSCHVFNVFLTFFFILLNVFYF